MQQTDLTHPESVLDFAAELSETDVIDEEVARHAAGLQHIDAERIATIVRRQAGDVRDLDKIRDLMIHTTAGLTSEQPEYALFSSRVLAIPS